MQSTTTTTTTTSPFNCSSPLNDNRLSELLEKVPTSIHVKNSRDRLLNKILDSQFPDHRLTNTNQSNPSLCIFKVIEEVVRRGINEEGIFRLTRNARLAEDLTLKIIEGQVTNIDFTLIDPHDLAMIIKGFTRRAFPKLIEITQLESFSVTGNLEEYFISITPLRRQYINCLAAMCTTIAANEAINRMNLNNLARVFAPNFFQDVSPLVEMQWINVVITMVETLFSHSLRSSCITINQV